MQNMRNKWLILGMVGALGLGFAGCGGDDDDDDDAAGDDTEVTADDTEPGGDATEDTAAEDTAAEDTAAEGDDDAAGGDAAVTAEGFAFEVGAPVAAGTEFTVTNVDPATHTFTADDDAFNEELSAETDVTVTAPAEPGEYAFHCEIHTNMTGTLVVE